MQGYTFKQRTKVTSTSLSLKTFLKKRMSKRDENLTFWCAGTGIEQA